jgi:asparagine N-glycosylation enzyme membrane subunit Stt3
MLSSPATNPNYSASTETTLDRIRASYLNEGAESRLSEEDKLRKEQLEAAHGLLVNYHSLEQAVPLLVGRFGISRATAYRRCTEAIRLFGDVTRCYKDGIRHILYEFAMKVFQLAASAKPPDLKAMNASIKNMAVLKGLDKDDGSALTPEVLANRTYVLNITLNGKDGQAKSIDLGNLNKIDAETYAQVVEAVEQSDVSLEEMRGLLLESTEEGEEDDD